MSKEFEFKGAGKTTITLDGHFIRIKRKGFLNLANHGLDGEKTLNINNITGVQLKEARLTNGYIQFLVMGSNESKGGVFAAAKDENTVMFVKKEQKHAEEIKIYVENILSNNYSGTTKENKVDAAEEIRKFKALMDDGIISEEEFQQKKKQLLGI